MPKPSAPAPRVAKRSTNRRSAGRTSGTRTSAYPRPRTRVRITFGRKRRTRIGS